MKIVYPALISTAKDPPCIQCLPTWTCVIAWQDHRLSVHNTKTLVDGSIARGKLEDCRDRDGRGRGRERGKNTTPLITASVLAAHVELS